MLIPGYNLLYWNFRWPAEIMRFVHKQPPSRMAQLWPGVLLVVATLVGALAPPLRFLIAFSVATYLSKKIGDVLPETKQHALGWADFAAFRASIARYVRTAEQHLTNSMQKQWGTIKLCVSAGLAAGFCFVIVEPLVVVDLPKIRSGLGGLGRTPR